MIRCIIIALLILNTELVAKHQQLSLQKALDNKLVSARVHSLGGYQGYCIKMELKNLSPDSLIILVEAGRRLNSIDEKNQDILVVKEQFVSLKKYEDKYIEVKGYCCQANNHSPNTGAKYDVNKLADSNLVILARYLNAANFNKDVEQNAIWAISDNKNTANVTSANDTMILPLRNLVATIKGEEIPWYTFLTKTINYAGGRMETFPTLLRGKLNFDNSKECYTTLHVLNEKGIEVCQIIKQWTLAGNNQVYNLNIPIAGLAKGKYTIELKNDEKGIAKREFKI
ncbi:MAG: hypothetical protein SFY56_08430 [Bacteroidota bacterium]|nr:hypothetical protein [Bacteroidota bacterium]